MLAVLLYKCGDVAQPVDSKQRWGVRRRVDFLGASVVRPACRHGTVVAIGHADDEIRVGSPADTDDLHSLPMQRVMGMGDGYPFQSWLGKGGSVL